MTAPSDNSRTAPLSLQQLWELVLDDATLNQLETAREAVAAADRVHAANDYLSTGAHETDGGQAESARHALQALDAAAWARVREPLLAGCFVATGRPGSINAAPVTIQPDQWASLAIVDRDRSMAGPSPGKSDCFYGIAVYRPMDAPDALAALADMSLTEAFEALIYRDFHIKAAWAQLSDGQRREAVYFHQKKASGGKPLPVVHEQQDFTSWLVSPVVFLLLLDEPAPPRPTWADPLADLFHERIARLIGWLRSGTLGATGIPAGGSGERQRIDRYVWSRNGVSIDLVNADLLQTREGQHEILSQSVVLSPVDTIAAGLPDAPKSKGGRPPTHNWDPVIDQLLIHLGQQGMPENGAELVTIVAGLFEQQRAPAPTDDAIRKYIRARFPVFYAACTEF